MHWVQSRGLADRASRNGSAGLGRDGGGGCREVFHCVPHGLTGKDWRGWDGLAWTCQGETPVWERRTGYSHWCPILSQNVPYGGVASFGDRQIWGKFVIPVPKCPIVSRWAAAMRLGGPGAAFLGTCVRNNAQGLYRGGRGVGKGVGSWSQGLSIVTLSVVKSLSSEGEILRSAQNDKSPNQDKATIKRPWSWS